jgi:hypothetical protein
MRKAILESVTTEVGLLPTDGVLGSFGGLVPGKSASVRLGRRGLLKTHLPEPDLDEAANGRAAY